jgi:hypothetical protein
VARVEARARESTKGQQGTHLRLRVRVIGAREPEICVQRRELTERNHPDKADGESDGAAEDNKPNQVIP